MKKYLAISFLVIMVIPSVTMAAWWNPRTWKIFQKKQQPPQAQVVTTPTLDNSSDEIKKLQAQIEDLKKQQPTTKTNTQKASSVSAPQTSAEKNMTRNLMIQMIGQEAESCKNDIFADWKLEIQTKKILLNQCQTSGNYEPCREMLDAGPEAMSLGYKYDPQIKDCNDRMYRKLSELPEYKN